ncbi:hypothetical protein ACFYPC_36135 [Streptomyces sp. NPDC005808]|uniref:hypothetical protein n=1 Tax=Streptomyces sp. NPDC005808 TaxID=3364734 RepID=UPI003676046E
MSSGTGGRREREIPEKGADWARGARGSWTVFCVVATVVLGPAAVTASALEEANAAPMYHPVKVEQTQAYIPSDPGRRKTLAT